MSDERLFRLKKMGKEFEKEFGSDIITELEAQDWADIPKISTGIYRMDYAMGGGVPAGRVSLLYGKKSSAKTTTCARILGEAQKLCSNCYTPIINEKGEKIKCKCGENRNMIITYLEPEGTFIYDEWMKNVGLVNENVLWSRPDKAEQCLEIADNLVRSGDIDILVLDSIAFLTPSTEIEDSVSGDAIIVCKINGAITWRYMKDLYNEFGIGSKFAVRAYDNIYGGFLWKEISSVSDHGEKNVYEIHTEYGRKIKVTADHSVFKVFVGNRKRCADGVYRGKGVLKDVQTLDLNIGDYLLMDESFQEEGNVKEFYLTEKLFSQKLYVAGDYGDWIEKTFSYKDGNEKWNYRRGKFGVYLPISVAAKLSNRLADFVYAHGTYPLKVKNRIDVSDIAYLCGYFVGDGVIHQNSLNFYVPEKDAEDFEKKTCIEKFTDAKWFHEKTKGACINHQLFVKPLVLLFEEMFGKVNAHTKRIPHEVYSWQRNARLKFLEGLADSDGSKRGNGSVYTTVSKDLVGDITVLCATLGIRCGYSEGKMKDVFVCGQFAKSNYPPQRVRWSFKSAGMNGARNSTITGLDGHPVKILEIKKCAPERVYDISVDEDCPSFTASGILVHNSMSDWQQGLQARLVGKAIRKIASGINYTRRLHHRCCTVILVNQIRMKIGVFYGNPETVPGGLAPGFATTVEVRLSKGKTHIEKDDALKMETPMTTEYEFQITKHKHFRFPIKGMYLISDVDTKYKKAGQVIDEPDLFADAERIGLIDKKGGDYVLKNSIESEKPDIAAPRGEDKKDVKESKEPKEPKEIKIGTKKEDAIDWLFNNPIHAGRLRKAVVQVLIKSM